MATAVTSDITFCNPITGQNQDPPDIKISTRIFTEDCINEEGQAEEYDEYHLWGTNEPPQTNNSINPAHPLVQFDRRYPLGLAVSVPVHWVVTDQDCLQDGTTWRQDVQILIRFSDATVRNVQAVLDSRLRFVAQYAEPELYVSAMEPISFVDLSTLPLDHRGYFSNNGFRRWKLDQTPMQVRMLVLNPREMEMLVRSWVPRRSGSLIVEYYPFVEMKLPGETKWGHRFYFRGPLPYGICRYELVSRGINGRNDCTPLYLNFPAILPASEPYDNRHSEIIRRIGIRTKLPAVQDGPCNSCGNPLYGRYGICRDCISQAMSYIAPGRSG